VHWEVHCVRAKEAISLEDTGEELSRGQCGCFPRPTILQQVEVRDGKKQSILVCHVAMVGAQRFVLVAERGPLCMVCEES
jgi:hypothetical protein